MRGGVWVGGGGGERESEKVFSAASGLSRLSSEKVSTSIFHRSLLQVSFNINSSWLCKSLFT